jgi:hypothetical protein
MAANDDIVSKLTDALNNKGFRGFCPMCHKREWMIQDQAPYSRIDVTDTSFFPLRIYKGFIPTYWLYCGNCGFVAQFMKSIMDDEGEPQPEEPPV